MPIKNNDNNYLKGRSRGRPGQFVRNLYSKAVVDRAFADQSIGGAKLTELANIPAGAGVIPSANIPASSPGYFTVSGAGALIGNDQTGNARGAYAVDVQTERSAVTQIAAGAYAVTIGRRVTGNGDQVVGIGNSTELNNADGAVGIGYNTQVGTAVGGQNQGAGGIAIGFQAQVGQVTTAAVAHNGIAIGRTAQTNGLNAMSVGYGAVSNGTGAIAVGQSNVAANHAVGIGTSVAIGSGNVNAVAIGYNADVSYTGGIGSNYAVSIGHNSVANGLGSVSIGAGAKTAGNGDYWSVAVGYTTYAGQESVLIGNSGGVYGNVSIGIGKGIYMPAASNYSIGMGQNTYTAGNYAIAIGPSAYITATGAYNVILGTYCSVGGAGVNHAGAIGMDITNNTSNSIKIGPSNTKAIIIDATAVAGQTNLHLFDVDNNTIERVTVGAADSGGGGFKVLRIPN